MIEDLLKFVGGGAVLLGCVAWLIKCLTKQLMDKDLAAFQQKLQRGEFVFSRLHDERIKILSELYSRMVAAGRVVGTYVATMGWSHAENLPGAAETVAAFKDYYEDHRIWFDKSTRELIDAILVEHSVFYQFANTRKIREAGLGKDWAEDKLMELWERTQEQLPSVEKKLESRFHQLIGYEDQAHPK